MPVAYPNIPLYTHGAQIEFVPRVIRDDGNLGPPAQRLTGKSVVWNVRVQWLFTPEEYEVFDLWFRNSLAHGAREFTMNFDWGNGVVPTVFRFTSEGFVTSNKGWQTNVVDANIYTYQQPPLANPEEYQFTWVSPDTHLQAFFNQQYSQANTFDGDRVTPITLGFVGGTPPPWMDISGLDLVGMPTDSPMRWMTAPVLPVGYFAVGYNIRISNFMGVDPVTFDVVGGSLPPGLILGSDGVLAGVPSGAPFSFLSPTALPSRVYGVSKQTQILTFGGTGAIDFQIISGSLPQGLSLQSGTGIISGTALSPLTLKQLPFFVLPPALNDVFASISISTFGGNGAKTFSLLSGTLPPNFTLDTSNGILRN